MSNPYNTLDLAALEQAVRHWRELGDRYDRALLSQPWGVSGADRQRRIALLLELGNLAEARLHMLRWLLEWLESLPTEGRPERQPSAELWRCLADVCERSNDDQLLELFWQGLSRLQPASERGDVLPLVGVPVLNGVTHLQRLVESLDVHIGTLAVVDQSGGRSDSASIELREYLAELEQDGCPNVASIRVSRPFGNIGVATAWNQILLSFPQASMALLVNHDVVFPSGLLSEVLQQIDPSKPQFLSLFPADRAFSAFVITALAWDIVGRFDERFYPAYFEDLDYRDRLMANPQVQHLDGRFAHGQMSALNPHQSRTIADDPKLAEANQHSYQLNRLWYYFRRRGPGSAWYPSGQWRQRWLAQWD